METVGGFAIDHRLGASHFPAIGAFSGGGVAYFDWSSKRYRHISVEEQVRVELFRDEGASRMTHSVKGHD
jgi:predicted DNA-binding protein with PD1-like motif